MHRTCRAILAALAVAVLTDGPAVSQTWPDRTIRMIVPYTGGGYTDVTARAVSAKLSNALGQTIVVENRPGANSVIGADAVAKASPDGYTFGTVIAGHAVNATLNPKLPFDVVKDFSYVSLVNVAPLMLVARKDLPINNVQELIAYAKANPGKLSFASGGNGSSAHMNSEYLKVLTGIEATHVPYRCLLYTSRCV